MVIINNRFIPLHEYRQQMLIEMANLDSEETGFAHYIWVGPPDPRHGHRIKVVNEPGRLDYQNTISVSISDHPKIVAGKPSSKLNSKKINWIFEFIKLNKNILLQHARQEITDRQLRIRLQYP